MKLLQTLADDKVINRLFKLLEKIAKDLKNPAKDNNGSWVVNVYNGFIFTTPKSGVIPTLVSISIYETAAYVKPLLGVWEQVNLSIDIAELEPLTAYVTKTQPPERVELYDDRISIILPNGTSRTFELQTENVDAYNAMVDELETGYTESKITDHVLSHTFMDKSFGGRGTTNILEINANLETGNVLFDTFLPTGINTRILRKNVVGVTKKSTKIAGTDQTDVTYSPSTLTILDSATGTDRAALIWTVDAPYYEVEQVYIVYKV